MWSFSGPDLKRCGYLLLLACAYAYASTAMAGTPMAVAPVVVKLDNATDFASVEVFNRGTQATGIEVEVLKVSWRDGNEQYEASNDFVVSPPTFRVSGEKSRLVRFHYSGQRQNMEGFYRLFIRQLPEAGITNQVEMVFNIGIPIFVAPLSAQPSLGIRSLATSTVPGGTSPNTAAAELRNTGNVTLTVFELEGTNCPGGPQKVLARISPGQKLALQTDVSRCATAARTDGGRIPLTLH